MTLPLTSRNISREHIAATTTSNCKQNETETQNVSLTSSQALGVGLLLARNLDIKAGFAYSGHQMQTSPNYPLYNLSRFIPCIPCRLIYALTVYPNMQNEENFRVCDFRNQRRDFNGSLAA